MKRSIYLLLAVIILASCGGDEKAGNAEAELTKLKIERATIDEKIVKLEAQVNKNKPGKATPVTAVAIEPVDFNSYIEVQAQVNGDQSITATPQAPGTVQRVLVQPGQKVGKGQTLATLDAAVVEQQIKAMEPQLDLQRSLYERQQKLWAKNIGTEVQLLSAKAQYEALTKQKAALVAQRNMYSIKSPISGTVDQVNIKMGDVAAPGSPMGIRVVSFDQLKVTANLGENYLGKVKAGDRVNLIFTELGDTMRAKLSYVSKAVDPVSRAFQVEIRMGNNAKLHPNMSCKMQIVNYENDNAIVVPVSIVQKTAEGEMIYIVDANNKAKAVIVKTGRTANGMTEVLSGLNAGDKVVTEGYEELENGELVAIK
jgi:membrane fusion protein, multidrug efflux system